jgi:hypothetical protein
MEKARLTTDAEATRAQDNSPPNPDSDRRSRPNADDSAEQKACLQALRRPIDQLGDRGKRQVTKGRPRSRLVADRKKYYERSPRQASKG